MKIPEKQRTLLTGIRVNDGFALVRAIRSTINGFTESPLSILAQRKQSLTLSGLDGWITYKKELLQLIRDQERCISDGTVDADENLTQIPELLRRVRYGTESQSRRLWQFDWRATSH